MRATLWGARARVGPAGARLSGLDHLRAAAITWVMVCHAGGFGLLPSDYFGWMGVDLFFVLSGYLVGDQLFRVTARGETPNYQDFLARRLLRTLPAYFAVVAIYVAYPAVWDRHALQPAWQFLTFTQNLFIDPRWGNSFSQAWSLCVEEQFYVVLPAVVLVFGRAVRPSTVVVIVATVLAFGMILRGYLWLGNVAEAPIRHIASPNGAAYMRYIYYPTWTRLDRLLAGSPLLRASTPILAIVCALATSAALFWLVEKPFLRLRERLPLTFRGAEFARIALRLCRLPKPFSRQTRA